MKRILLCLALAVLAAAPTAPADSGMLLDSYAAIVNGKVITVGEVLAAMSGGRERLEARHEGAELRQRLAEEYQSVRDRLVESELILQAFESQGGVLPDRAIEDHINSVIHEQFNNDRAAFLRALAAERLTFSEWRKQMKDQLIIQYMRGQEVQAKILVTPFDLQQAYDRRRDDFANPERVRLRTLVLAPAADAESPEAADARDRDLLARLAAGELDIEDAPGTPSDPEWFEAASLHDAIRAAIESLEPGAFAGPVELGGSRYLIQLLDREAACVQPFEEVASDIERDLRRTEFERLNRIWIDSLRSKYFVQVFTHDLFD
jgi:peptidyl-prolyl cis-trans isomerase SurA